MAYDVSIRSAPKKNSRGFPTKTMGKPDRGTGTLSGQVGTNMRHTLSTHKASNRNLKISGFVPKLKV